MASNLGTILTVAIPTYNRPHKVLATLKDIIPQLNAYVTVMVIDNCSDIILKDFLLDELGDEIAGKINVIRNRVNIGMDGNIGRCFELCETPYVWTLGDDDKVTPDAIEVILNEIEKYKSMDLIGFNFNSNCVIGTKRESPVIIQSTKDLAEKLDVFGNWLFVSTGVYRTAEYLKYFRFSYWGSYSMAAFIPPTMVAIGEGKAFILSEKYIVNNVPLENVSEKWSDYQLALSLPSILEARAGFKKDEYKAFGQKLDVHFSCIWPADVMYTIIRSVNYDLDLIDNYHVYIYKQLILKTWEFRTQKSRQLKQYYICLYLLKNKSVLKALCKVVPKIKTKSQQFLPFYLFKRDTA